MRKGSIIKFVSKSSVAYISVLVFVTIVKKVWTGSGKGRIESHYSISWEQVWLNFPYYAIAALFICYPFFYVFYRDARKEDDESKKG